MQQDPTSTEGDQNACDSDAKDAFPGMRCAETHDASRPTLRGGLDPRKMAQLRWSKERERKAGDETDHAFSEAGADEEGLPDEEGLVLTEVDTSEIMAALQRKALEGDV